MKTLVEKRSRKHTRFGFYLVEDQVLFECSRPLDTDTWEWTSAKSYFRRSDFERGTRTLDHDRKCEITGTRGETLRLKVLPKGTVTLELWGGGTNNLVIADLGIRPAALKFGQTAG